MAAADDAPAPPGRTASCGDSNLEIAIHNLFPNPVINAELNDVDNDAVANFAYALQASDQQGEGKPPEDGWQSKAIAPQTDASYDALLRGIHNAMGEGCKRLGLPMLKMTKSWININPPKTYIDAHEHEGSIYSGVYYVKVPPGSGDISFHRGDVAKYFLPRIEHTGNSFLAIKASLPGRPGLLLMFPSWLTHKVSLNNSEEDRISVSFNFGPPDA